MNIYILVGTRPNFIKITQFKTLCKKHYNNIKLTIVHTGQHSQENMSSVFFNQFNLIPDYYLNISNSSPNQQIAEIMVRLEELCATIGKPDWLLVPGDVNSTLAGALFANKSGIKLAHIEAGLRSHDRTMPEEFNRILTDQLSNLFFVTEESAIKNLIHEGFPEKNIHFVGNTMIDTLMAFDSQIEESQILNELTINDKNFVLMTLHRPATVDNLAGLNKLFELLDYLTNEYNIIFPIHPRTINNIKNLGLNQRLENFPNLIKTEPLNYFSFQKLVKTCSFILTDSGGIQEESTFVGKPCLTLRPNTERPVTLEIGTNTLIKWEVNEIIDCIQTIKNKTYKTGKIPPNWDGQSTRRILDVLAKQ